MSAPGEARSARPTDLPAIATILDAVWNDLGQPIVHTVDELQEEFSTESTSLDDVLVWDDSTGEPVGVGYTVLLTGESLSRCYLFGGVHPAARHHGIGGTLIDQLIDRSKRRLHGCSSGRRVIRTHRPSASISAARLLATRGFTVERYFTDMHRDTDDPPTAALPTGYRLDTWDPDRSEEIRELKNLAFNDHWGSTPSSIDTWRSTVGSTATRLDLSRTVLAPDGALVGLLLTRRHPADDETLDAKYAWMDLIATHPEHRGRGIAAAMIVDALDSYRRDGIERAALEVDADSPTGAHRLYTNLGFEAWREVETDGFEIEPVTAPGGATSPRSG